MDSVNKTPIELAKENHRRFQPTFIDWLQTVEGSAIYQRFEVEALRMSELRDHWSARTIIEFIRHETALRESGTWKINNNTAPDCARLFALRYPKHEKLFEFREQDRRRARQVRLGVAA